MLSIRFSLISIILFFGVSINYAQTFQEELAAINNDVWNPFIEGVNLNRPELYNSINASLFFG